MNGKIPFTRLKRVGSQAIPVTIRPLPASADDLLLPRAALRLGVHAKAGADLLARTRQASARFPGDPFASAVQAHAEILFGDRAVGTAMLDALLAANPKDAELLYLRGYSDLLAGRADEQNRATLFQAAGRRFAQAYKLDENYYPTLYAYTETRSLDPLSDNGLETLLLARWLAPQVEIIAFNAAIALMQRKRFPEAERLLQPLAANPHGGAFGEKVRAMLAQARSGEAPGFSFVADEPEEK
jgi:Flp pilus assembly protein TadD